MHYTYSSMLLSSPGTKNFVASCGEVMVGKVETMERQSAPGNEAEAKFRPRLHGDLLSSSLLAFLRNWNAYGYQLVQELARAGLPAFDSTPVYRTLRQLERAGLVSSFWDTSQSGPARPMYSLTRAGHARRDVLARW